ncbi:MAG: valine--tRNA ligase, partial [bacterium]|nr:valine--tRNA ligase [bacterium]
MDSKYQPQIIEKSLYEFWESNGYFKAKVNKEKKPFSIILPPPNANGSLHLGHAMFVYEDLMIRYHKMIGDETFWVLGLDHAGFETQYVYEKHLRKEGKSRFDFDRETLFKMIWDFVMENKGNIKNQMRRLGFALDWSKEKFTMDPEIVKIVYNTFKQLHDAGLLYRAERLVNYCTRDGTSFSDLEVINQDTEGILYFVKYPLINGGFITVATTRPETMFGDVAVMVHPEDKRYKKLIGQKVRLPLTDKIISIIADEYVEKNFGTGVVKVTPLHDQNDFEVGKRHNLPGISVIGFDGKMKNTRIVDGMKVKIAREEIIKKLQELQLLEKTKPHKMVVKTCYRCGNILEPLPLEQWYVKIRPLADKAKDLVKNKQVGLFPKRFVKRLNMILDDFIDWNISRQIVWGIRIPAYKCKLMINVKCQMSKGWFVNIDNPKECPHCKSTEFVQDPDTLDTWFSSAQWPFVTLMTEGKEFFEYFYPTTVMETGHDILRAWVARMMMIGNFVTKKEPFKQVFLHGMVRDAKGQKMSKSKGNVIDPIIMVDKYGADALRGALIFGTKEGGDVVLSEQKIIGMRNFSNKIWNMARFLEINQISNNQITNPKQITISNENQKSIDEIEKLVKDLQKEFKEEKKNYMKQMKAYKFSMTF